MTGGVLEVSSGEEPGRATAKERRAWYLYDFGNSAYAAVVLLAVYSAYFKGTVVGGAKGSQLWGRSVAVAMLVVALLSPVLGAIADFSGTKKRFLFVFTAMAVLFTSMLFFVQPGDVFWGMLLFILAEIGYRGAQVFYNSLLPEIAAPEELSKVSGIGWAIGSAGGIICLLLILPVITLVKGVLVVRASLIFTAVYFAVFTIPLFTRLKERAEPKALPAGESYLTVGFKQAFATLRKARHYREFIRFMLAFLIYNDGIMMVMNFAAIIGAVLFGLEQQGLIVFVILVQATNVLGAYLFGLGADRWGAKRSLLVAIALMFGTLVWLYFIQTQLLFFGVGAVAGLAMAGMQAVSRSMVGQLSPAGQSAEFYGFFAVAGRTSSFIGPMVYGWVAYRAALWFESQGWTALLAEQQGQRMAILAIGVFLLVGMGLLFSVDEDGRQ